jgi:hypothetical protein
VCFETQVALAYLWWHQHTAAGGRLIFKRELHMCRISDHICSNHSATCLCCGVLVALARVLGTEPAQPVPLWHLISRACSTCCGTCRRVVVETARRSAAGRQGSQRSSGAQPRCRSCTGAVIRLWHAKGCAHNRPPGWRPSHSQYPAHCGWNAAGQPSQQIRSPPNLAKRGSSVAGACVQLYGTCRVCARVLLLCSSSTCGPGSPPARPAALLVVVHY